MSRRQTFAVVALIGLGACQAPPADLPPYPSCVQPAEVAPLDPELIAFLPVIGRPNALAAADALIADGTVALARREPFALPADPDWREDPFGDPTWVYEYQSLLWVLDPLLAFDQTGEARYLDAVELHLERWLTDHLDPLFRGSWGDHIMANRTRILLLAWERMRARDPGAAVVDRTCQALGLHGDHLTRPDEYTPNNNHGYFQDEALLALSAAFPADPRSPEWSAIARERIAAQIEYAVTGEGVHREHSPSYHAGMQRRFARFARLLDHVDLEIRLDIADVVESMWEFSTFGALPTGDAPLLGDSTRWFGTAGGTATDIARYSLSQGATGVMPAAVDRVFERSGYAFFRDRWHEPETFADTIYVGFVAAYFSRVHKHCDDLSIILSGLGEPWLIDSGFWSYDRDDLYGVLANSPAGHNLVEVDGRSYYDDLPEQDPQQAPPLITDHQLGATTSSVAAEHRFNPGVAYRRELDYHRPARLEVRDRLSASDGQAHDYVLYWHLAPDKQVAATGPSSFVATSTENPARSLAIDITASAALDCSIIIGADDPYQGWFFPSFLEAVPAPVIACAARARDVSFDSAIELSTSQ